MLEEVLGMPSGQMDAEKSNRKDIEVVSKVHLQNLGSVYSSGSSAKKKSERSSSKKSSKKGLQNEDKL